MVKGITSFIWKQVYLYRCLIILWSLISVLIPLYFLAHHYWPLFKARNYFYFTSLRMANLERGGLTFFIERQRRSVFELSRSVYMQNLITFRQGQSEVTEQQILKMESFIKAYQGYFGYKQIMLLDKEGQFVFSTVPKLRGKNIHDAAYNNGLILPSFKLVTMTWTSDITPFNYSPVVEEKALFITMPVFFDAALNGFLVVQLNDDEVEQMLAENVRLAGAEEYLIVQRIHNTITFVVSPSSDPHLALPLHDNVSATEGLPPERAALGYQGHGVIKNHAGELIIVAWYFLPQLNWGFVCKDMYVYAMRYVRWLGYGIWFLVLCALLMTILYVMRRKKNDESLSNNTVS